MQAANDVIGEKNADVMHSTNLVNEVPTKCAESLCNKTIRYDRVLDKQALKRT